MLCELNTPLELQRKISYSIFAGKNPGICWQGTATVLLTALISDGLPVSMPFLPFLEPGVRNLLGALRAGPVNADCGEAMIEEALRLSSEASAHTENMLLAN